MGLIEFLIVCVIVGAIVWATTTYVPMDAGMKRFIQIAAIVVLALWFLKLLGVLDSLPFVPMRQLGEK